MHSIILYLHLKERSQGGGGVGKKFIEVNMEKKSEVIR